MIPGFPSSGAGRRLLCCVVGAVAIARPQAIGASGAVQMQGGGARRGVVAVEAAAPIVVDGALDEQVWRDAEPAADFVQAEPHEGEPATEATEVRVAFDRDALYIGVVCRDGAAQSAIVNDIRKDF